MATERVHLKPGAPVQTVALKGYLQTITVVPANEAMPTRHLLIKDGRKGPDRVLLDVTLPGKDAPSEDVLVWHPRYSTHNIKGEIIKGTGDAFWLDNHPLILDVDGGGKGSYAVIIEVADY